MCIRFMTTKSYLCVFETFFTVKKKINKRTNKSKNLKDIVERVRPRISNLTMGKVKETTDNYTAYHVIHPMYIMTKIMGLAPYSFKRTKTNLQWFVTKPGIMQTVVYLTIGFATLVPTFHYQVRNFQAKTTDYISIYSDIFRTVNGTILCSCVLFMTLINRHEYCTLMNQMVDFDRDLKQLGIQMDNKTMFKNTLRTSIFVYVLLIFILSMDLIIFASSQDMLTYIYWFGCMFSFFITLTATFQLLCFTYLLYKR